MYKSYDVTLEFLGSPADIMEKVIPLVDPEFPGNLVDMIEFLKKLNIKQPKESIKLCGDAEYVEYTDELLFTINIDKKEDEIVALDFIHDIYKKVYSKIGEFEKDMEVDLILRVSHGDLYYNEEEE